MNQDYLINYAMNVVLNNQGSGDMFTVLILLLLEDFGGVVLVTVVFEDPPILLDKELAMHSAILVMTSFFFTGNTLPFFSWNRYAPFLSPSLLAGSASARPPSPPCFSLDSMIVVKYLWVGM
ncbi:hypothetical protein V6Z11_D05G253600 [Gossypium hirsutum]